MKKDITAKRAKRNRLLFTSLAITIAIIMLLEVALPFFAYLFA